VSHSPEIQKTRGAIHWMAGHSVAANLLMLLCLVGGFFMMTKIKQELFPDIEIDAVMVSVAYPGASPEEVERGVILAIEEAVRGLDGVDEVRSQAREGYGQVTIEALLGADVQQLGQDIQGEVDRITTFPREEAEEPQVTVVTRRRGVLDVVLHGDADKGVLHEVGEQLRDQLLQDPDITQVEVTGLPPLEISIEISQENLRRYGLTVQDVANGLGSASVEIPAGGIKTTGGEILVRVTERRDYGREFARLPVITTADGSEVLLGDIATIEDGFEDTDRWSTYNGRPAVIIGVYRVGDQTPIDVADAVDRQLADFAPYLPPGIQTAITNDRSQGYRDRVNLLLRNGALGLVLVLVVLGLFLEARLAFWVMMGIPISFMGSFLLLPATGVSINMVSLFAYIIALGIVVDDAIVVGENVYHYHQSGMPFLKASVRGAREVAVPVTFSILTNIAAFMPLYFIPGTMGKIFMMIPVVVCVVFLVSLGESLFILPAHLGHQKERRRRGIGAWLHNRQQGFSRAFMRWVRTRYGPFLELTLHHRGLTVSIAATILMVVLAFAFSGRMGMEMFPKVESDFSEAKVVLTYGSPVEKTEAVMQRLLDAAHRVIDSTGRADELAEGIIADIGDGGSHSGRMRVLLADADIRESIMSTEEFTNKWRKAVGDVPGVEYMTFAADVGGPGGRGRPVAIELSHRDINVLASASSELAAIVGTYPKVKDVDDGFQPGKQQLDFTLRPEGKRLGLTARDVARQLRNAYYGAEGLRQQRGRNEIKVMVRLPEAERRSEQTIEDLMIRTPAGTDVPLMEVDAMQRGRAYTTIDRREGRRVVTVSADVSPRSQAGQVLSDIQETALPTLVEKYPGLQYSFEGHQADMRESIGSLKTTALVAMMVIFVLLAIPFRSYSQPLIVMASIPFGIVGAIVGHLIMGYDLSLLSMFGIVALSGVVVNDSLVLIDFANRRQKEHRDSHHDAIVAAATQRFRPIILTTLTTFGGLSPMIFETSRQARFLIPMALSLGFGIVFATLITLVIVPSLYMAVEDIKRGLARTWRFIWAPPPTTEAAYATQQPTDDSDAAF
jgi:multidrug efflux pump subunit AcrB